MSEITFATEEKTEIVHKVQKYFSDELDQDIGSFDAEFLIDFFTKEIGAHFYNRGLLDAQQLVTERMDEIGYSIQELEKPISR
ncbi:DUF2164 domain-containing protein [Cocleimonas sp. KMM 6892]|uniref:DUF2164 domain-containing protein n=1 Tax=unclassified Cocleimonas TaxID=2639732 RepID=UPI002DB967AC|nr:MULTISPECIES: DUF2164 domain-containing protein [unclassified Cocleimonas]MEB8431217.1 DUF2164 domain-containing protein [Cocleimonas sp. KMM 6892]MEC4714011.1 DUF2164 domain-containing protein [Cocleimonas sp. KMM 6895]MEC4743342.1 DUF2164 domain-containing protein [Cocleimonas sp. KMM 6896]